MAPLIPDNDSQTSSELESPPFLFEQADTFRQQPQRFQPYLLPRPHPHATHQQQSSPPPKHQPLSTPCKNKSAPAPRTSTAAGSSPPLKPLQKLLLTICTIVFGVWLKAVLSFFAALDAETWAENGMKAEAYGVATFCSTIFMATINSTQRSIRKRRVQTAWDQRKRNRTEETTSIPAAPIRTSFPASIPEAEAKNDTMTVAEQPPPPPPPQSYTTGSSAATSRISCDQFYRLVKDRSLTDQLLSNDNDRLPAPRSIPTSTSTLASTWRTARTSPVTSTSRLSTPHASPLQLNRCESSLPLLIVITIAFLLSLIISIWGILDTSKRAEAYLWMTTLVGCSLGVALVACGEQWRRWCEVKRRRSTMMATSTSTSSATQNGGGQITFLPAVD
ncbi:MAG: hypothetical protein M1831_003100 [Alyxoria varia]|nr:MAG: hypothetical protein M1831_003100 [Alyxoria varia]